MSDGEQIAIGHNVAELVSLALDHGLRSRRDGATLVPFALIESDGHRYIHRFATEPHERALTEAKAFVSRSGDSTSVYAIAYDGFITVDGTKFDAILVVGGERGASAYIFAQRYDGIANSIVPVGDPAIIGRHDSLLDKAP